MSAFGFLMSAKTGSRCPQDPVPDLREWRFLLSAKPGS